MGEVDVRFEGWISKFCIYTSGCCLREASTSGGISRQIEEMELILRYTSEKGWHLFSQNKILLGWVNNPSPMNVKSSFNGLVKRIILSLNPHNFGKTFDVCN